MPFPPTRRLSHKLWPSQVSSSGGLWPRHGVSNGGGGFTPPTAPPSSMGFPYSVWLDARQTSKSAPFVPNNGDSITTIANLVSGATDLFDGTGGTVPIYQSSNGLNGLPDISFSGSGSSLTGEQSFNSGGAAPFSFMLCGQFDLTISGDQTLLSFGGNSATQFFVLGCNLSNFFIADGITKFATWTGDGSVIIVTYDGVTIMVWQGGNLVAAMVTTLNLSVGPLYIGKDPAGVYGNTPGLKMLSTVTYNSALGLSDVNTLGLFFSGTGLGAPATGLIWNAIPIPPVITSGTIEALWISQYTGVTNGSNIALMPDLSGNKQNAIQVTSSKQPVLSTNDLGVNGKSVATFDGVNSTWSHGISLPIANTIIVVGKMTTDPGATTPVIVEANSSAVASPLTNIVIGRLVTNTNWGTSAGSMTDSGQSCLSQYRIMSSRVDGLGSCVQNTDGGSNVTGVVTPYIGDTNDRKFVGSDRDVSLFFPGKIAAIICISGKISDAENTALINWLNGFLAVF